MLVRLTNNKLVTASALVAAQPLRQPQHLLCSASTAQASAMTTVAANYACASGHGSCQAVRALSANTVCLTRHIFCDRADGLSAWLDMDWSGAGQVTARQSMPRHALDAHEPAGWCGPCAWSAVSAPEEAGPCTGAHNSLRAEHRQTRPEEWLT